MITPETVVSIRKPHVSSGSAFHETFAHTEYYHFHAIFFKVNIQVFQGSGIGKMEDNMKSADPLSYTTNGS